MKDFFPDVCEQTECHCRKVRIPAFSLAVFCSIACFCTLPEKKKTQAQLCSLNGKVRTHVLWCTGLSLCSREAAKGGAENGAYRCPDVEFSILHLTQQGNCSSLLSSRSSCGMSWQGSWARNLEPRSQRRKPHRNPQWQEAPPLIFSNCPLNPHHGWR